MVFATANAKDGDIWPRKINWLKSFFNLRKSEDRFNSPNPTPKFVVRDWYGPRGPLLTFRHNGSTVQRSTS
ncbi:hypothetical protein CEXT_610811 [Caerostris extrusa]|uniref:Uncharacterized protein n=1 Tax=Caerostris extrusa TaxID=172846 RepID=A0AAV4QXP4_CAEEX|nr:hypothetical protein CEXT_610811 [Caerostris extrusa]